jgi:Flp pilus assembly protein TadB
MNRKRLFLFVVVVTALITFLHLIGHQPGVAGSFAIGIALGIGWEF